MKHAAFVLTAWASVSFVGAVFWLGIYLITKQLITFFTN
jgi:hypothetical protein